MRWLLTFISLASWMGIVHGQVRHGPRAGIGLATRSYGFMQQTGTPKPAILVGWGLDVPVKNGLSLMVDLLYVTKGSASRNVYTKEQYVYYLNYAEVPLMFKLDTDKKAGGFFITAGLYGAYLLSSRFLHTLDGTVIHDVKYDLSDNRDRVDYGAGLGLGLQGKRVSFEIRGESGLTFFDPVLRVRNTVYAAHITFRFPGRPKENDKPAPADEEPMDEGDE